MVRGESTPGTEAPRYDDSRDRNCHARSQMCASIERPVAPQPWRVGSCLNFRSVSWRSPMKRHWSVAAAVFQMAINKDGIVRGNYYNATTDATTPVKGSLDKKSQRVAWTIGDKKDTVYEVGLYNLTKDETTMLIHFGKDKTEQRTLFRIEQPKE